MTAETASCINASKSERRGGGATLKCGRLETILPQDEAISMLRPRAGRARPQGIVDWIAEMGLILDQWGLARNINRHG